MIVKPALIDFGALTGVRIGIAMMSMLPEAWSLRFARVFVWGLLISAPRLRKVAERNLALVFPERSNAERQAIRSDSFEMLARNLVGFARAPKMTLDWTKAHIDLGGLSEVIAKARKNSNGSGILIAAVHFGVFELMFQAYALVDRPVSVLARNFGLRGLDLWWKQRREIHGHKTFERKGGYDQVLSRLKSGEDVAVLFDQNVKAKHATFVPFFGRDVATTKTLGIAALRTGCPVVFVAAARVGEDRYRFFAEEIINPINESGSAKEKVQRVMERLHRPLERLIGQYPDHWFWIHRRFKTRPNDEPENLYS